MQLGQAGCNTIPHTCEHHCTIRAQNFAIRVSIRSIWTRTRICLSWRSQSFIVSGTNRDQFRRIDTRYGYVPVSHIRIRATMLVNASSPGDIVDHSPIPHQEEDRAKGKERIRLSSFPPKKDQKGKGGEKTPRVCAVSPTGFLLRGHTKRPPLGGKKDIS